MGRGLRIWPVRRPIQGMFAVSQRATSETGPHQSPFHESRGALNTHTPVHQRPQTGRDAALAGYYDGGVASLACLRAVFRNGQNL